MATTKTFKSRVAEIPSWKKRLTRKFQTDVVIRISDLLNEKGISQKELAERAGFQPSFISRLLSGSENLTLQTIARIEDALGDDVLVIPHHVSGSNNVTVKSGRSRKTAKVEH
jgi:transcriptional regulator with XRE-family HTH domain